MHLQSLAVTRPAQWAVLDRSSLVQGLLPVARGFAAVLALVRVADRRAAVWVALQLAPRWEPVRQALARVTPERAAAVLMLVVPGQAWGGVPALVSAPALVPAAWPPLVWAAGQGWVWA